MSPARVLIIAGENSGDKHGASLVQAFHEIDPSVEFFGVGGARMLEAGVRLINTVEDLAVVGIFEILSQLPRIRGVFTRIKREARSQEPQAAILIDSPDFNLRLARFLKKQRIPVLYYISPSVWAWRKNRLKTIRKTVDKMMLIFPFEQPLYHEHGIASVYVGHPLLEQIETTAPREEVFHRYGFDPVRPLLVLLPGSRRSEIRYHMPTLMSAAAQLRTESRAQFALMLAENLEAEAVRGLIPKELEPDIRVIEDTQDYHDVLAAGDLALSSCGTANLESALLETPVLAFYRISPLTYSLGKPFVKVDHYSIVNILAGREVVPELIQRNFTPERLTREALRLLDSCTERESMVCEFRAIRESLGKSRASLRAAEELRTLLEQAGAADSAVTKTGSGGRTAQGSESSD
ncbi:MAG: lipid-A-disaccharide synthase [Candidatus Aminicenantaceae bacterium]